MSEFISFITPEASERCHQEKQKTISGEDILFAMSTLGFDSYVEPLKLYLQKFREVSAVLRTVGSGRRHLLRVQNMSLKMLCSKVCNISSSVCCIKLEYVKYHTFPCLLFITNFSR